MTRDAWDELILRHLDGETSVAEGALVTQLLADDGEFRSRFFTFVYQAARFHEMLDTGMLGDQCAVSNGTAPSEAIMGTSQVVGKDRLHAPRPVGRKPAPYAIPVASTPANGTPVAKLVPPMSEPPAEEPVGSGRRVLPVVKFVGKTLVVAGRLVARGIDWAIRAFFRQTLRRKLIMVASAALLFLAGWLTLGLLSSGLSGRELEAALASLGAKQRTWWDTEAIAQGCKDPDGAFVRLRQKQRDWWESEGLTAGGDPVGAASLSRLEEMEKAWWESEGLASGKPCKDPAGALARLDKINRKWLKGESVAKANPDASSSDDPDAPDEAPSRGPIDLADLKVQLLEKEGTRRFLDAGGTQQSEEAVQLGLQWLAAQQKGDGSWVVEPHSPRYHRGANNVTGTAFALLPFLARGETHKGSQAINIYTKQVDQGIRYLISQQKPDGQLPGGSGMYTHAVATIALCEDFGMTADPILRGPCQRAIDYIIFSQDPNGGGWRYGPKQPGDLSVSSWALMALKSGQMAGLQIPRDTLDKATQFLKRVNGPDGRYGYTSPQGDGHSSPVPAVMTAAGIVCRQYLQSSSGQAGGTEDIHSPTMTHGADIILKNLPKKEVKNYYYWYYATYALLPIGGDAWKQWNPQVRDLLVGMQDKGTTDPSLKGSWDPKDSGPIEGAGRVGVTALSLLTLEVYYRHLPLNRPELGEMAKDLKTTK